MDVDPVAYFEHHHGIRLQRVHGDEYAGPCPWCGGRDRFRVWQDRRNYWCRPGPGHCNRKGFVDELMTGKLSREERQQLALEARVAALERQQKENDRRLSALERMARCTDHLVYHRNLAENDPDDVALGYWLSEGMTPALIEDYCLGWCPRCPTDRDGRPSYTIPVFGRDGKTLINIRHRLMGADKGGKYRPHMPGLGAQLFNARLTNGDAGDTIVVTEGEKKSIVASAAGLPAVGIMGKRAFKRAWLAWLAPFSRIYIALDPDAMESAFKLAALFEGRGRVVSLPAKLDDMIVRYGATEDDLRWFLATARPIQTKGGR